MIKESIVDCRDLLDTLLCPFKIFLHFLCSFHAIREISSRALESSLSQCLQLEQLSIFCVELARTSGTQYYDSPKIKNFLLSKTADLVETRQLTSALALRDSGPMVHDPQ